MLIRRAFAAASIAVLAAAPLMPPTASYADGGWGGTECGTTPTPGCDVNAGTPGGPGDQQPGGGNAEPGVCRSPSGVVIPCERDGAWAGLDGCYYEPVDPSAETIDALGGQPAGAGGWYARTCYSSDGSSLGSIVWLGAVPAVSPAILAREARAHLSFPEVAVSFNPAGTQLVGVPSWLHLSSGWEVRSATASVPGMSVVATATPNRAVWSFGDGAEIVCYGPGAAWQPWMDPHAASPDCGTTFSKSSAGQPGEVFTVTVTVIWSVTWIGGGQSGAVPPLTTTGTTTVRVAEAQTVILG